MPRLCISSEYEGGGTPGRTNGAGGGGNDGAGPLETNSPYRLSCFLGSFPGWRRTISGGRPAGVSGCWAPPRRRRPMPGPRPPRPCGFAAGALPAFLALATLTPGGKCPPRCALPVGRLTGVNLVPAIPPSAPRRGVAPMTLGSCPVRWWYWFTAAASGSRNSRRRFMFASLGVRGL